MLIIGSAQSVNILISIGRMKMLAIMLGPSGVGLLSIYNSLHDVAQQTAGLGMSTSGVREISSSQNDAAKLSRVRRVLLVSHFIQGVLAMIAVWFLREDIAILLFGDAMRTTQVGLIGLAIFLSLLAAAQMAVLQGLRKIAELGKVTVFAAFVGTPIGLLPVWLYGELGLIWLVIVQPLCVVLFALYFTKRLPNPTPALLSIFETWDVWKPMAKLGTTFMLGGLATAGTLLLVRGRISQELGLDAAGHFAAAWGISITYVGFLLGAMAADYYPRLTEVIRNKTEAVRMMNDQAQLGLAIGGPFLLLLIGLAPWVITLLYSVEFSPAVAVLQWQTVGNVFKLASWALGFSLLASSRGKTFFMAEAIFNLLFIFIFFLTLPRFGILAAGSAFTIAYLLHFALMNVIVRRNCQFRWHGLSLALLVIHASLAFLLLVTGYLLPQLAALLSVGLALGTGIYGIRVVLAKVGMRGRIPRRLYHFFENIGWPIKVAA